jgi:type I restriction enzyme R subunit
MTKERYKDDSIDLAGVGEKVRALINEHLIDLGINPKIPPIELLAPDFLDHVRRHSGGDPKAKASEMEHAIRKHCTIHFDEDPAFYQRLSEKLENLIEAHRNNWEALAEGYEQIRKEAEAGRTETVEGLTKEATTFYDYVVKLGFEEGAVPSDLLPNVKSLMIRVVDTLQNTIGIIDFWKKPIEVKKLRGNIDTEILLAGIPQLADRHERIAVEIVKLAEKRHAELTR